MAYRVAILTPQSVHGVVGGAENLWAGLERALNDLPGVEAHWLPHPTPEGSLEEVLKSYAYFADLCLDDFDQVITTKYPAWAVTHHHHVVYLQHTLRGLYDTYPVTLEKAFNDDLLDQLRALLPRDLVAALLEASQPAWGNQRRARAVALALTDHHSHEATHDSRIQGQTALARLAQRLQILLREASNASERDHALRAFPGPFARAVVRLLDAVALEPPRVQRYLAISHTVAGREGYFPQGVKVRVAHHPSFTPVTLPTPVDAPRDLVVTASRVEHPKRLDLLIKAYTLSGLKWPFWVVGQGPELDTLKSYVERKKIQSVVFKGHLSSEELVQAYQRARFVPFAPMQEDYGLITVEAFMAGAPVITTTDAGGPTELVQHLSTGALAEPTAKALARCFQALERDAHATWLMGQEGHRQVQSLQWPILAQQLLGLPRGRRKRLLVLNTFPTEPTTGGGRLRLKGLYGALSDSMDVHLMVLAHPSMPHHLKRHRPGWVEELVPVEQELFTHLARLEAHVGASCFDLATALYPEVLKALLRRTQDQLTWADTVVVSHPYLFPVLELIWQTHPELVRPLVYEAHNVETELKRGMYGPAADAAQAVADLEVRLLRQAQVVMGCSPEDLWFFKEICETQGVQVPRLLLAPNGMDVPPHAATGLNARMTSAAQRGYRLAVFMGSGHGPNYEAVEHLLALAPQALEMGWRLVVLGSAGWRWLDRVHTPAEVNGVYLAGVVSDAEKLGWLAQATVGLNPMSKGSGTNLKMAEYAAVGLPMVSTAFGARGGLWQARQHYQEMLEVPSLGAGCLAALRAIDALLQTPTGQRALSQRVTLAAATARARLHWQSIADQVAPQLP